MTTSRGLPTEKAARATGERVGRLVASLQTQYVRPEPTSYSRRVLAELRRGLGKEPQECPQLAEFYLDPDADPRPGDSDADAPTPSERAAHLALGLYGLHQQSGADRMHRPGVSFGRACGRMKGSADQPDPGVVRRFQALGTANGLDELAHHARGLVQLMRRTDAGFDYGEFAAELVRFQDPRYRDSVRLRWGRDFYRVATDDEAASDTVASSGETGPDGPIADEPAI